MARSRFCLAGAAALAAAVPLAAQAEHTLLTCRATLERSCNGADCDTLEGPPQEMTLALPEGSGSFCLYTFCAPAVLARHGAGPVFDGELLVVAGASEVDREMGREPGLMRFAVSIDMTEMTYLAASIGPGDSITTYSGTCEATADPGDGR